MKKTTILFLLFTCFLQAQYKISISPNTLEMRSSTTNELYRKFSNVTALEVNANLQMISVQYQNSSYDLYFSKVNTISTNGGAFIPTTTYTNFITDFSNIVVVPISGSSGGGTNSNVSVTNTPTVNAGTGFASTTLQTSGNTSLNNIDSKIPTLISGRQPVDGSGVTQPISATSLPLPNGASTELTQVGNGSKLSTISTQLSATNNSLGSIDGKTPSLGQNTNANSVPIVLTATQIASLTPLTTITANIGTISGVSTESTLTALNNKVITTANGLKVDNSAVTQPISAVSLPLPNGASTAPLQTAANVSLTNIDFKIPSLGQALAAASVPTVLPLAQITALTPPSNTGYALDATVNSLLKPASTLNAVTTLGSIINPLPVGSNTIGNTNQTLATAEFAKITDGTQILPIIAASTTVPLTALTLPVQVSGNSPHMGALTPTTIPTRMQVGGIVYNAVSLVPTTGQSFAVQSDAKGNALSSITNVGADNKGSYTFFRSEALTNTVLTVKATSGNTYGYNIVNPNATPIYVKIFDAATVHLVQHHQ